MKCRGCRDPPLRLGHQVTFGVKNHQHIGGDPQGPVSSLTSTNCSTRSAPATISTLLGRRSASCSESSSRSRRPSASEPCAPNALSLERPSRTATVSDCSRPRPTMSPSRPRSWEAGASSPPSSRAAGGSTGCCSPSSWRRTRTASRRESWTTSSRPSVPSRGSRNRKSRASVPSSTPSSGLSRQTRMWLPCRTTNTTTRQRTAPRTRLRRRHRGARQALLSTSHQGPRSNRVVAAEYGRGDSAAGTIERAADTTKPSGYTPR